MPLLIGIVTHKGKRAPYLNNTALGCLILKLHVQSHQMESDGFT